MSIASVTGVARWRTWAFQTIVSQMMYENLWKLFLLWFRYMEHNHLTIELLQPQPICRDIYEFTARLVSWFFFKSNLTLCEL